MNKLNYTIANIKAKIKQHREYCKLIKQFKANNLVITKTLKEVAKKICQQGG